MTRWVVRGLGTGVRTTRYPEAPEEADGVSPGLPLGRPHAGAGAAVARCCPTGALAVSGGRLTVDYRRCVHSFRCVREVEHPLDWQPGYEWAAWTDPASPDKRPLPAAFARSLHILVVDAGDCGACLREVKQLNNPYYNMHRLGFYITPTPRNADLLLVVGSVTVHMRWPLLRAYDAMPTPRRVVAAGACALSGGVFAPSPVSGGGIAEVIPVDVVVPGAPPPPLAILHGLLLVTGRAESAPLVSPADGEGQQRL